MKKRSGFYSFAFLGVGLAALVWFVWSLPLKASPSDPEEMPPGTFAVVDLHVDLSFRSLYKAQPFDQGSGQFRAQDLLPHGVRGVVLPLYVPEDAPAGRSRKEFERSYAHVFQSILSTPPYSLPGCGILRAGGESRRVSTFLAFEGAAPLGADRTEIERWVLRGVKLFGLVHTSDNSLATSSGKDGVVRVWDAETRKLTGLTATGRKFVETVIDLGGIVDVSHASDPATDEVLSIAEARGGMVVASHSNARALAPHARNLKDDQIGRIARLGGVVGVNFHQPFLRHKPGESASLKDVVQQIRYLRRVAGVDAVAIGSDFEGGISAVPELSDATRFQRLAQALLDDGLSRAEVERVLSRNALRVLCTPRVPLNEAR